MLFVSVVHQNLNLFGRMLVEVFSHCNCAQYKHTVITIGDLSNNSKLNVAVTLNYVNLKMNGAVD